MRPRTTHIIIKCHGLVHGSTSVGSSVACLAMNGILMHKLAEYEYKKRLAPSVVTLGLRGHRHHHHGVSLPRQKQRSLVLSPIHPCVVPAPASDQWPIVDAFINFHPGMTPSARSSPPAEKDKIPPDRPPARRSKSKRPKP